jgi:hypothetical protein
VVRVILAYLHIEEDGKKQRVFKLGDDEKC